MLKTNSKEKQKLLKNFNAAFIIKWRTGDKNAMSHGNPTKLLINSSSVNQRI
jgi:hypothetical protein